MKRKSATFIASLLAVAALLAGCSNGDATAGGGQPQKTLLLADSVKRADVKLDLPEEFDAARLLRSSESFFGTANITGDLIEFNSTVYAPTKYSDLKTYLESVGATVDDEGASSTLPIEAMAPGLLMSLNTDYEFLKISNSSDNVDISILGVRIGNPIETVEKELGITLSKYIRRDDKYEFTPEEQAYIDKSEVTPPIHSHVSLLIKDEKVGTVKYEINVAENKVEKIIFQRTSDA